jgi:hypothetical protein
MAAVVFAHQGGWDESLMVLGPIALFGWLLWRANRRAQSRLDDDAPADEADDRSQGDNRR